MPFIPNPAFEAELKATPEFKAMEREVAGRIADRAKELAPVVTGRYRDSIHVEDGEEHVQVVADAVNESGNSYADAVEFGTSTHEPHATLRTALESVGP